MPKLFCLSCNKSTSYESKPAAFCSHCGKPYVSNASTFTLVKPIEVIKSSPPVRGRPQNTVISDDDNFHDDTIVPNIDKLDYELEHDLRPNREKGNQVIGKGALGVKREKQKVKKVSKKEFEKQWGDQFQRGSRKNPISLGE